MAKRQQSLIIEGDWSRGMLKDMPRTAMPAGTVFDSVDYLLDRPGIIRKRGGHSAYGPPVSASVSSFLDSSASAHDIVPHGDAHIDTTIKKFGDASANFDGTGDFISMDGSAEFEFGTGDFAIDFWMYKTANPSTNAKLYDGRPAGFKINVANKIGETFSSGTSYATTTTLAAANKKLYLASVVCQQGITVTGITGCGLTWVKVAEQAVSTTAYVTVFRALVTTGATSGAVTASFSGTISGPAFISVDEFDNVNLRGTNGSGAIIQNVVTTSTGSNSKTITLSTFANVNNLAFGAYGNDDGADPVAGTGFNKMYANHNAAGRAIITIQKTGQGNPKAITGGGGGANWCAIGIEIGIADYPIINLTSTGTVQFIGGVGTLTSGVVTSSAQHHIEVDRTSGTTRLFIDGVVVGATLAESAVYYLNGTSRPAMGASGVTEGTEPYSGYLDEIRVTKGISRHSSGFTPPVAEYSTDGNTVFLAHNNVFIAAATALRAVAYTDFPNGAQLLATADDNHLYRITSDATTDLGSVGSVRTSPLCKPVLHVSGTSRLIIPANDGASGPFSYDGTTLGALGGTPPAGKVAGIYKARLLLANSVANPNRLWFSPLDLSSTWDTANAWVDFDHPITGLATIRNALLVFSSGHTDYVTGSVPPGTQGFDMSAGPLGEIGCSDARSIGIWQDNVIFANANGVYLTNGAAFRSLVEPPEFGGNGVGAYWRELMLSATANWQIHGGVIGDFYIVTIRDDSDTLVDTLMCHLTRRAWWRLSNFDAGMYSSLTGNAQELYFAARDTPQVIAVSGIFNPSATTKNDADGSPVEPQLTMRFLGTGPTLKAYGFARMTYDMEDAGGDNPSMAISVAKGAQAPTFTAVDESPLLGTTDAKRKRFTLNKDAQGLTIKLVQTGPSVSTEIFAMEVEERQYEAVIDGE